MILRKNCWIIPVLVFLCVNCSKSQRFTGAVKKAKAGLSQGDQALMGGRFEEALGCFEGADKMLKRCESWVASVPTPLQESWNSLKPLLELRLNAFKSPEGGAQAAIKLAGESEDLSRAFWDGEGLCIKALGSEKWQALSPSAQSNLAAAASGVTVLTLGRNEKFVNQVVMTFGAPRESDGVTQLDVKMTLASNSFQTLFEMRKMGPAWRISDFSSDFFKIKMSDIFARTVARLESVKPLEESLGAPDFQDKLKDTLNMVFDDYSSENQDKKGVVVLNEAADLVTDSGQIVHLSKDKVVQLTGEKRVVNGQTQVQVNSLDISLGKGGQPETVVGWVPEDVLPWTGESQVWDSGM